MPSHNVTTDRLIIMPMSYSLVHSVLFRKEDELDRLGIRPSGKWPLQDTLDILRFVESKMSNNFEPSGFEVWMIVKQEDMTIIGDAGFKGEPNEKGEIEIGFGLIKEEQGKGYGYEVAKGLISWAFSQNEVKTIKADCLKDNYPSSKVLQRCGMHEVARDKELIYWEIKKAECRM